MDGMGGMGGAGAAHAGHDHSAHAAHDKFHSSVERLPDGSYRYTHGAFTGHVVPGAFFLAWGCWWALTTFAAYLSCLASKVPFRSRGWRALPVGPRRLRALPLEPLVKLVLPLAGILGELWLGHESFRSLYAPDGKFVVDNLNDWQHSTMYASFMASGAVDLLAHWLGAPAGIELAFLALAFLAEGLLLVFHLKGPQVEILVHLILVLQVFATVAVILVELAVPASILVAAARPWLTMLQGAWWIQTAYIMYRANPAWDPDYMGAPMFVPVPFVLWTVGTALALLCLFLGMKAVAERRLGRPLACDGGGEGEQPPLHAHARLPVEDSVESYGGDLELSGGLALKAVHAAHGA